MSHVISQSSTAHHSSYNEEGEVAFCFFNFAFFF
jgi:hypothetical protein